MLNADGQAWTDRLGQVVRSRSVALIAWTIGYARHAQPYGVAGVARSQKRRADAGTRDLRRRFAEAVKSARERAGLTQQQLAERIGRTQQYVSLIERARNPITMEDMTLIAQALNLDFDPSMRPRDA